MEALALEELSWRGSFVERFEREFAQFCKVDNAIACSSGTAALHLALAALGIREGDEVILPALTYIAAANAVRYVGATPVFCDVRRDTWGLDPEAVDDLLRSHERVAAILPVHLYGIPCDMSPLQESAIEYGTNIIEDAAEAHGALYAGNPTGSLGDIAAFSFFANKIIATGEGGMVTTNDDKLAEKVRLLRGQGQVPGRQFYHSVVGFNYRMTNLQAAVGVGQLEQFEESWKRRQVLFNFYTEALQPLGVEVPSYSPTSTPWLFTALLPERIDRDRMICRLAANGIETRPTFPVVTQLPPYSKYDGSFPVSADIAARGISLPTHCNLTMPELERVVAEVRTVLNES